MRVKEPITKKGNFWLPSSPEKVISGVLTIDEGGKSELETIGIFEHGGDQIDQLFGGYDRLERIVGKTVSGEWVTLENCVYRAHNTHFSGVSNSILAVNFVYIGVAYEDGEEPTFNTFRFSTEGMVEWVGLSGIHLTYTGSDGKFPTTAKVEYVPQNEICFKLDSGMELRITFGYRLPDSNSQKEAKFTHSTYFKIISEKSIPLTEFFKVASKLTSLICLGVDQIVSIDHVTVTSKDLVQTSGERTYSVPISIYYLSFPYSERLPLDWRFSIPFMLFSFLEIQNVGEQLFNKWLNAYDRISPSIDLYFSSKTEGFKFLDGQFLGLAQALESLHSRTSEEMLLDENSYQDLVETIGKRCPEPNYQKWLSKKFQYGNQLSLSQRLGRLIKPFKRLFGTGSERDTFKRKIVDTRNYLTHYDKTLEPKRIVGEEMLSICLKMEALIQLHFLLELGFSEDQVIMIAGKCPSICDKLKIPMTT